MAKTPFIFTPATSLVFGTTFYTPVSGGHLFAGVAFEAYRQLRMRHSGGVFSNLSVTVQANTLSGGSNSAANFRKASANGNQTVSITNGATGTFEDTSNTDSVAIGDLINSAFTSGGTSGAIFISSITYSFAATSDTVVRISGTSDGLGTSGASTKYSGFGAFNNTITTEANTQARIKIAATCKSLFVYVSTNITSPTTVTARKNGVNTALTVSIGSGASGVFEDTTNSFTTVSGDDLNFQMVTTGGTVIIYTLMSMEVVTTDNNFFIPLSGQLNVIASGATDFFALQGYDGLATEAQVQARINFNSNWSKMTLRLSANAGTTGTGKLRQNGTDTALSVAVGSGATGWFEDITNTVSVVDNDLLNFSYAAVGGNHTVTSLNVMGAELSYFFRNPFIMVL